MEIARPRGRGPVPFYPSHLERCPNVYVEGPTDARRVGGDHPASIGAPGPGWTEIETEGAAVRAREKRNEGN